MPMFQLWDGIDRIAFCENAILLEMRVRAQGRRSRADEETAADHATLAGAWYPYSTSGLLDDLALVAAGPGGGDNVTATCLETRDEGVGGRHLLVRIARNAGDTTIVARELKSILDHAAQGSSVLPIIISRCRKRVKKHAERLATLCRNVGLGSLPASTVPPFSAVGHHHESADDINEFGEYVRGTHFVFAAAQLRRLRDMVEIVLGMFDAPSVASSDGILERLTQLAYLVRKSSTARQIIEQAAARLLGKRMNESVVEDVVQRIGQLSRFVRAANEIEFHIRKMRDAKVNITVEDVPRRTLSIPGMAERAPTDLRNRGGHKFQDLSDSGLKAMIERWPKYREHSEIQLIMFYEENPQKDLQTTYVGCDKLSCFLCFNFMKQHGRFHSQGCHQSLYSLWTVRDQINTDDAAVANRIRQALLHLSKSMERKIEAQRDQGRHARGVGTGPESVANLSRATLISRRGGMDHWPVEVELDIKMVPEDQSEPFRELQPVMKSTKLDETGVSPVDLPAPVAEKDSRGPAISTSVFHQTPSIYESSKEIANEHCRDVKTCKKASQQDLDAVTFPGRFPVRDQKLTSLLNIRARSPQRDEHHEDPVFRAFSQNTEIKWKDRHHTGSTRQRRRNPVEKRNIRPRWTRGIRAVLDAVLNLLFGEEVRRNMKAARRRYRRDP